MTRSSVSCCRSRHTRSIPTAGWRRTCASTSARARALYGASAGEAHVVIASAVALLPKVSPPQRLLNAALSLQARRSIAPQDLAELLIDAGFTREDPVDEHGEFCVRGGIVDLFPPARQSRSGSSSSATRSRRCASTILPHNDPSARLTKFTSCRCATLETGSEAGPATLTATAFDHFLRLGNRCSSCASSARYRRHASRLARTGGRQLQRSRFRAASGACARTPAAPVQILIDWDTVASRLAAATRFEGLAIDRVADDSPPAPHPHRGSATWPVSRRWSSAAGCRTGWPRFAARASARRP